MKKLKSKWVISMSVVLNDLYDYNLKIYQDTDLFKFSLDSLLLSEFVEIKKNDQNLIDLCSGNAPIPLILASKYNINIKAVELQKEIYNLAQKSIEYNNLTNKIEMFNFNVLDILNYFPGNNFDIVTCNPPFFKVTSKEGININEQKAIARHEITITLEEIFKIASKLLKNKGSFYLVHRPVRLEEIFNYSNKYNLHPKIIEFIYPKTNNEAIIVLIKFVKNSNLGTKVYSKIINEDIKTYQGIFKKEVKI